MPRPLTLTCLAALAALLVGGCGGGGSTTVIERTVTETSTPAKGGGETSDSGAKSPSVESKPSTSATALHLSTFQSPSGNIGCGLLGGIARCDIRKRDWSPPPRPPGCPSEVDFGQGLQVSHTDRSGSFVCAGDTALNPSATKLAYGRKDRFGGFLCMSSTLGVACRNSAGHGFFISIQAYRAF